MSEERLQEIKDSVNFQKEILLAHNMETLCVDEEQELIEEIERLNNRLKTSNDTCNYLRNTIDKAIEYMDRRDLEWGSDEHDKMMDILKGSDK